MLKIRLARTGKRNQPTFRIVVTEHTAPPKSGYIEHIGFYNPRSKEFKVNKDKLEDWQNRGAHLSDTVNNLLVREKILSKKELIKTSRKPKKKKTQEKKEEEAKKPKAKETEKEEKKAPTSEKPKAQKEGNKKEKKKPTEKKTGKQVDEKK